MKRNSFSTRAIRRKSGSGSRMGESHYQMLDPDSRREIDEKVELQKSYWMTGHFDFCIIHCDEDAEEVSTFCNEFCRQYNIVGVIESDPALSKIADYFDRIEEMVRRSTYVFMYLSRNFGKDRMCLRHRSDLLTRYIEDETINVIPVYTKLENIKYTPSGMRGMTGFKLYTKSEDSVRVQSTFSEQSRNRRVQREKIEAMEHRRRERELKNKLSKELLEGKNQSGDHDERYRSRDESNISTNTVVNANEVGLMHVGNQYHIHIPTAEEASALLENLTMKNEASIQVNVNNVVNKEDETTNDENEENLNGD